MGFNDYCDIHTVARFLTLKSLSDQVKNDQPFLGQVKGPMGILN